MLAPLKRPARPPIIPGDKGDRTGTRGILRRALADIRRRFAGLQRDVLALFSSVPILGANELAAPRTAYMLTPEQLGALSAELQRALDRWLLEGAPASVGFGRGLWWDQYAAEAAQRGTAQTVANLTAISPAYAAQRTLRDVLFSEPYRTRLAAAQVRSMDHWTGIASQARADLSSIIGRAVVDGKNPRAVRTEIAERLGVSRERAELYAQTDIPGALRDARAAEADYASEQMGIALGLLWTSSLKPTTRQTHAARHGKVFTTANVREFYGRDGNRYRCYCSTTEALLDEDGTPVLSASLRRAMAHERAAWEHRAHADE